MNDQHENGRHYMVPCVLGEWGNFGRIAYWPVMGELHEDGDIIGFKWQHYHIDWRFVARPYINEFQAAVSRLGRDPLAWNYNLPLGILPRLNINGLPKPVMRRRKFHRGHSLPFDMRPILWMPTLEAAHAGCRLAKGHICPHRGYDLSREPVVDGIVTCPMHGLRWIAATGELAPRTHPMSVEK